MASQNNMGNMYIGGGSGFIGGNIVYSNTPLNQYSFSKGDRVVLIGGSSGIDNNDKANPIWGENGEYIAGVVHSYYRSISHSGGVDEILRVLWDNGQKNEFDLAHTQIILLQDAEKKKPRKFELDTTKLDPLVIDTNAKNEIIALLQQHKHAKKIFEEWGLGEVIEYGKGMTIMFHGPPGTGKTWGAHCIAKALNKELLIISAAEIETSEPGGANRNIQNAFKDARENHKVLFLDECDSLIANRNHLGMILSSQINTLLTEIEKTEEVVILATNMIANMDAALERRISLIVEFPMPNKEQRKEIWKKLIPSKMPLDIDVDLDKLSKKELSGGLIKNVVLQAARLAVSNDENSVSLCHFEKAIERVTSSQGLMGKGKTQWGDNVGVAPDMDKFIKTLNP